TQPVSSIPSTVRMDDLFAWQPGGRLRDCCKTGGVGASQVVSPLFSDRGGVEWILRLAAAGGEGPCVDIMEISKPDDLGDIAKLGLTLAEAKQLLAGV